MASTYAAKTQDIADQATRSADSALRATQRATNDALEGVSSRLHDVRDHTSQTIDRFASEAESLARRGLEAVRDNATYLRERAAGVSASTVGYIKDEPMKSILIAAATGAALMALVSLLGRSRD